MRQEGVESSLGLVTGAEGAVVGVTSLEGQVTQKVKVSLL